MATRNTRSNTRWIWLGSVVALIVIFYLVRVATRTRVPIRTAVVIRGPLKSTIATNGKVEPQVNFEAHAPFPGLIKALYVHEGEKVHKGELLVTMDDTNARAQLASARTALTTAQVNYQAVLHGGTQAQQLALSGELSRTTIDRDHAEHELAALKQLQQTGAASPSEVAAAQGRLDADNAALANLQQRKTSSFSAGDIGQAKAALVQARSGYAAAQQVVSQSNVRAPFDGTVYLIPVSRTEYVQQGDLLLQMADLSKMQVRAYFDEPEIGRLRTGQPVMIEWDAEPNKEWHGEIARIPSTIITYTTRNVGEVLVTIGDAHNDLLPNTNVRVTAMVADIPDALYIPHEALHVEDGQYYVYRVQNGVLRHTNVKTGVVNVTQVQILGGVKQGQVVALGSTNGQPIGDGVAIDEVK